MTGLIDIFKESLPYPIQDIKTLLIFGVFFVDLNDDIQSIEYVDCPTAIVTYSERKREYRGVFQCPVE